MCFCKCGHYRRIPVLAMSKGRCILVDCTKNGTTSTGTYSCLLLTLTLQRLVSSYLVTTYIPEVLIVMVSWLGFWIDVRVVPARITLGLFTLLGLLTEGSSVSAKLPRVTYLKAIDVWLNVCLLFVIGALVEFAIAYLVAPKETTYEWETDVHAVIKEVLKDTLGDQHCCCCYSKCVTHRSVSRKQSPKVNGPTSKIPKLESTSMDLKELREITTTCTVATDQTLRLIKSQPWMSSSDSGKCALCEAFRPNCCQCPLCVQIKCPRAPKAETNRKPEPAKISPSKHPPSGSINHRQRSKSKRHIVIWEPSSSEPYLETNPRQRLVPTNNPSMSGRPRKSALKVRTCQSVESANTVQQPDTKISRNFFARHPLCRLLRLLCSSRRLARRQTERRRMKISRTNVDKDLYDSEVDAYSRFLFPAGFLLFNCCYWLFYLVIANDLDDIV
ncbi:hypothetical protein PHET_01188 [Paragonimus heterotremus]|uniref:Neurotransmitter-gated ion-channel transmembrane domain-containing protein n=1 Tax=Paragonimus heterotremus TaxID=100268 RepID=A0A8J4T609_9TREM|nr:hypothetical protein PHET_01188 [Paragonimus heterotremus]